MMGHSETRDENMPSFQVYLTAVSDANNLVVIGLLEKYRYHTFHNSEKMTALISSDGNDAVLCGCITP